MPSKMGRFSWRNVSVTNAALVLVGGSALLVGAGCYAAYRTHKQHQRQTRELEDRELEKKQKRQQQLQQQRLLEQQQRKQQQQQWRILLGELTSWHEEGQRLRCVEPPAAQAGGGGPGSAHKDQDRARAVAETASDARTSRARVASSPEQSPIADVAEPLIPKNASTATGGDEGSEEGSNGAVRRTIDEAAGGPPLHGAEQAVNTLLGAVGSAAEYMKVGTASNMQKVIGVATFPFRKWGGGGDVKG